MVAAHNPASPVAALLGDVDRLRSVVAKIRTPQIWSAEHRAHIRAVATAWFRTYKAAAAGHDVVELDRTFQRLLTGAERAPTTRSIRNLLKLVRPEIVRLQTNVIANPYPSTMGGDPAPSFLAVPDLQMRQILSRRWDECVACLGANAPLAAIVMMGGLLESLFLARVNREPNQAAVMSAKTAPKDRKTGATRLLKEWGLGDFISVAHELNWITRSGKDVSAVLQNYRNYIHPQKELSNQISLTPDDARMLWVVAKEIAARLM